MREPDFNLLATHLMESGIAPRHAHRTVNELRDHYDDLVDAAVDDGDSNLMRDSCRKRAREYDEFVVQMAARRELKTWAFRYPRVAIFVYPLACLAVLPALPVFAGVAHAGTLARWSASLIVAGLVTASLLLTMQLSILLG